MALSGQITTNKYSERYYKLVWSATQSIESNSSTISYTLSAEGAGWWAERTLKVVLAGTTIIDKTNRVERWNGVIKSGTITVAHDTNGNKSFNASIRAAVYGSSVNLTASQDFTLNPIPRAAVITNTVDFTDETAPTVTFTNVAGYQVRPYLNFVINGEIKHTILRIANYYTSPYSWSFTPEEITQMLQVTKNVKACSVIVGLDTYDNSAAHIGNSQVTKTFTIVNAQPTLSPVVRDTNDKAIALTNNANTIIKGFNTVELSSGVAANKGSDIVYQRIIIDNYKSETYNGYNGFTTFPYAVNNPNFYFLATDSRGYTVEKTVTLPMVDYIPLTSSIDGKIELDSADGTKANITITISGNYFRGSFGAVDNTLTLSYVVTGSNDETFTEPITLPESAFTDGGYAYTYKIPKKFDYKNSYVVEVTATDKINNITASSKTLKAIPVFDWGESDFNFNVPISIQGEDLKDFVLENGASNGWTYRKWQSGKAECWKTVEVNTAISQAWGSMYVGSTKMSRQSYPIVFTSKPVETATLVNGNYSVWLYTVGNGDGVNGAYASAIYNVCRPDAVSTSGTYYINLYVCGNWR